jgi:hypothetical protein
MTYATRRLAAGDLFTATPRDARILVALRRARHTEATPIPADWQKLPWPKLRALAKKVDALAAIEAQLEKRAAKDD